MNNLRRPSILWAAIILAANVSISVVSADIIYSGDTNNEYEVGISSFGGLIVNDGSNADLVLLEVGVQATGTGEVTVDGMGSTLNAGHLALGQGGIGKLVVQNGAESTFHGWGGPLTIGRGSSSNGSIEIKSGGVVRFETIEDTNVGHAGFGSIRVESGLLRGYGRINLAYYEGSTGEMIVSGSNSTLALESHLAVAMRGSASLTISDGALADIAGLVGAGLNEGTVGDILVSGAGTYCETGGMQIGANGDGSMTVESGATVEILGAGQIGMSDDGVGTLTIRHAGTQINTTHPWHIGRQGIGTLNIEDEAILSSHADFTIGKDVGGTGMMNLNGGRLDLNGHNITRGVGQAEFSFIDGTMSNVATFGFDLTQEAGTLEIGSVATSASMRIEGNYILEADGSLDIDLHGPDLNDFDHLDVEAIATLEGNLKLQTVNYQPDYYVAHDIIHSAGMIGQFLTIDGVAISSDQYLAVIYDENRVSVVSALPGDANIDTTVDFNDLLAVAQNYESANISTWVQGDFNGSGSVDFNDLLLIAQHYGSSLASNSEIVFDDSISASFHADWQSALVSVPEPSGALVFGVMTLIALRRSAK